MRRARVPHHGRDPHGARGRARRATTVCSSPASTSPPAATSSGSREDSQDQFGDRVRDTPISETAIIGLGVGAAMAGMRPVVEMMYLDFLGVCFDQLLNQAAKIPFMTGGAAEMALTVRTQFGAGRSSGSQHSQSLEALLAHIPGSDRRHALDAGRHLRPAAGRDPGPEPGDLHREPAALRHEGAAATGRLHPADRQVCGRATRDATSPWCRSHGWCTRRWPPPRPRRRRHLCRSDRPADRGSPRHGARSSSRCTRRAGSSSPTRRSSPSASAPRSPPRWPARGSGISTRPIQRIGAAATPPPYAPDLERAWLPDRERHRRRHPPPGGRLAQQPSARAMTRCWISLVPSPISSTFESQ